MQNKYQAIRCKQTNDGKWLVFFSASAHEIDVWAGIPEKKNFDSVESTGFQRSFKTERLDSLINFYSNNDNILQNPLLCAPRKIGDLDNAVYFIPDDNVSPDDYIQKGTVVINYENFHNLKLVELLQLFNNYLGSRAEDIDKQQLDINLLAKLKERLSLDYDEPSDIANPNFDVNENGEFVDEEITIIESSHISDLWQEVACRISILKEYDDGYDASEILGFTKDSIISYLKPVIVVDGQHRLIGAIEHSNKESRTSDSMTRYFDLMTSNGLTEQQAKEKVQYEVCRHLPISLVLSDDPAEHVFQFVVVNQKATPINNALLGTIVSTTLATNELERVAGRLKDADIELEASQAVSFATRNCNSPFYGLVQTGISGEQSGKLPWTVMRSLISIFKDLRGGKFYSDENRIDYADLWRRRYLGSSDIINESDKYSVWSSEDGMWRDVFINFWTCVRDKFGNTTDCSSHNYWGHTSSNLFNKISLTILATDFFKYLCESKANLDSADSISQLVDEWLTDVDANYFNRDWKLANVKKDAPGTRKQWSKLWLTYRQDPRQLPQTASYKKI
ncbi:DGQHR domain [Serratia fonticola]|uniref:hypothetical protein n=1 Tax=Serratia fonticola TaxID=47917 RepID=UPI00217A55CF|nr:hypothetical protein [Serratia fonticola]CAI1953034.1 DGQHR domain [Serratia fonticola]